MVYHLLLLLLLPIATSALFEDFDLCRRCNTTVEMILPPEIDSFYAMSDLFIKNGVCSNFGDGFEDSCFKFINIPLRIQYNVFWTFASPFRELISPGAPPMPSPTFIPHFCPTLQKEILFVRQPDGSYTKYHFKDRDRSFQLAKCSDCRLPATEKDLQVIGTAWSRELGRYVISTRNRMSGALEHYVYSEKVARFEQIQVPAVFRVETLSQKSRTLFTVGGASGGVVTIIKKDHRGMLKRERFNEETQRFEEVPPTRVRSISDQNEAENLENQENSRKTGNLDRWLSDCIVETTKPKSSRSAEIERDRQLECLLRCREKEYSWKPNRHANRSISSESEVEVDEKEKKFEETSVYDYPDYPGTSVYEEFTRKIANSESPKAAAEKRKLKREDVETIRKLAKLMGNPGDEGTVIIEEDVLDLDDFEGSERTV